MTGISSKTVSYVWLVWDGFGGCIFQFCATKKDAKRVANFNGKRDPSIKIVRYPVTSVKPLTKKDCAPEAVASFKLKTASEDYEKAIDKAIDIFYGGEGSWHETILALEKVRRERQGEA